MLMKLFEMICFVTSKSTLYFGNGHFAGFAA